MKANQFLASKTIFYGQCALKKSGDQLAALGNKALLVTDEIMVKLGHVKKVTDILEEQDISYIIYDQVNSEPKDKHVIAGVEIYKQEECDFLITVGGGSPIDATKAIGLMITNSGEIKDYMGMNKVSNPTPPIVAIPTTAGTGSEVTKFTIITDTKNDIKMLIGSPYLIPNVAITDPCFTKSVPPKVTAATGIDALTHAIEAYISLKNQPLTDNLALSAITRIAKYLRKAWANGDDKEARSQMMLAAMEAGMAFNNSSVTVVHGMSRPIGALFNIPHGVSNAILLPSCMEHLIMGAPERFADIAKAMQKNTTGLCDLEAAKEGLTAVKELIVDIEIPTITELGVSKDEFLAQVDKMAEDALASGSPDNAPCKLTQEQIVKMYKKLF